MEILLKLAQSYLFTLARVTFFAGVIYFIFWKTELFRGVIKRIPNRFKNSFPKREFSYTIVTLAILQTPLVALVLLKRYFNFSRTYTDINEYGYAYFFLSIFLIAFTFDTLFYWTHRWMHQPRYFKYFHKLHHSFNNPTPWAAYGVSIGEAIIIMTSYFIALLCFPWHPLAALIYSTLSILNSAYVHSGYEVYPRWFVKSPFFKWINTSTHHNLHHQDFKYNFAIYFTFWDKIMNTEHPRQQQVFDQIHGHENIQNPEGAELVK